MAREVDHQGRATASTSTTRSSASTTAGSTTRTSRTSRQYIQLGPLGQSFSVNERVVLLIDEIDKADVEFPNDLLHELDAMSFHIPETGDTITAVHRPIVVITSNNEKELPDAFLRRCVFHFIEFPDGRADGRGSSASTSTRSPARS